MRRAEEMATGPVLGPLREASDDLFAWAAARVARQPDATLEDVLGDMAMYGLGDLAEEASRILEKNVGHKAGASAGIEVSETTWTAGGPGSGTAVIEGVTWKTWDYREDIHVSEELAAMLRQPEEGREKRECVTKAVAAGVAWRSLARQPTLEEADSKALELRKDMVRQALEAEAIMGEASHRVAPIENELRTYTHDIVKANHDKDFRSLAAFPLAELEDCRLVVVRADYKGMWWSKPSLARCGSQVDGSCGL